MPACRRRLATARLEDPEEVEREARLSRVERRYLPVLTRFTQSHSRGSRIVAAYSRKMAADDGLAGVGSQPHGFEDPEEVGRAARLPRVVTQFTHSQCRGA